MAWPHKRGIGGLQPDGTMLYGIPATVIGGALGRATGIGAGKLVLTAGTAGGVIGTGVGLVAKAMTKKKPTITQRLKKKFEN